MEAVRQYAVANGCGDVAAVRSMLASPLPLGCTTLPNCAFANVTLCVHEGDGHFNRPSFTTVFDVRQRRGVLEFFQADACRRSRSGGGGGRGGGTHTLTACQ
jgi:hypothetical protein